MLESSTRLWHKICYGTFGTRFAAILAHDFLDGPILARNLLRILFGTIFAAKSFGTRFAVGTRFAGRELAQDLLRKLCRTARKKILRLCRKKS